MKYNCAICGKEEELTTPEEEMKKELIENFGTDNIEDCEIVCDDCYNNPNITRAISYAKIKEDLK